ncbi:glycosyltransferase [Veillonella sp.]|jgi:Glycosyltransferase|uniref:glycosyltransferase n=1 Tax=Veillonella sp. TaxID=1926307 RepID=UPI001D59B573|nr:glycosyltransferase [Veillonella sp.]MBS4965589.1 glycosyltransferase [Veillonella sp.]MDU2301921.1 glycosyltransferase [Veillonella sp.]MDU2388737.1 glycosyltransferase [Veillonella sp.]
MINRESRRLRVLQVGMTRNLGGIETYLIEQFRHLDKSKIDYDFVNITGEYSICYEDEILASGSKIFKVVSRHKNPLLHYWQWFNILLQNKGVYDVIVLNTNSLEYVFPLVLGKIFGIPVRVIHSHNSGFENKQGLARRLLVGMNKKLLAWSANLRFACSQFAGQWMFKDNPYHVIYNAIDIHKYDADLAVRDEMRQALNLDTALTLLHVGRFSYQKNHSFLLDIFKEVHSIQPDSVLLLVGDTTEESEFLTEVKRKIKAYGLENVVRLLGRRDDVNKIMQAADVLVMPSFFEGLTVVGIEAQASDLPLLLSDTVTKELGLLPSTQFISLEAGPTAWAEAIVNSKQHNRQSRYEELKAAGYDIGNETERVEKLLIDAYHELA